MLSGRLGSLAPVNETLRSQQTDAQVVLTSASAERPGLRQRIQSAHPAEYRDIREHLREELHMRFWSLQHDGASNRRAAAAEGDPRPDE